MFSSIFVVVMMALVLQCSAFSLQTKRSLVVASPIVTIRTPFNSYSNKRRTFKLFAEEKPKISRDSEGEYFASEFDEKPLGERLPYALGFLAVVSLPFVVGLIYLYSSK
jgi:hypothetical protein